MIFLMYPNLNNDKQQSIIIDKQTTDKMNKKCINIINNKLVTNKVDQKEAKSNNERRQRLKVGDKIDAKDRNKYGMNLK